MRRHANFAEYVPLALILIALLELNGVMARNKHVLGVPLVVARLAHAFAMKADSMKSMGRLIGAGGTALITAIASVWLIVLFVNLNR